MTTMTMKNGTTSETQDTYGMRLPEGKTCADCARFRFCDVFLGGNIAANKERFTRDHPAWMVAAAEELFAHDMCDAWNWNDYVKAATVIIARHFAAAERDVREQCAREIGRRSSFTRAVEMSGKLCGCRQNGACSNCGFDIQQEVHAIRQVTASDPENIYCRQATILLDSLYKKVRQLSRAEVEESQGQPEPPK